MMMMDKVSETLLQNKKSSICIQISLCKYVKINKSIYIYIYTQTYIYIHLFNFT